MAGITTSDLRYPIGECVYPRTTTAEERKIWIRDLAEAPGHMRAAVARLSSDQLDTPYRPGGWTVRQVVHHVPDSHMNAFVRFKLALTEDVPTIKPYDETAWAKLSDYSSTPIEVSLALLEKLHDRWVRLLESMTETEFGRAFRHPEIGTTTLGSYLAAYSWHSRHHVAHITSLRQRMGWT
jgi:uncharacterized damage-inducible protein DinB